MGNYVILTDSACDLKADFLNELNVEYINQIFHFENEDKEYTNEEMEVGAFYERMRNGESAKTAAINPEKFAEKFEEILSRGSDILYLGFSSGLSTTFNSSNIAKHEAEEKYPDQKIICIDTLCASAGQGLLVYFAAAKRDTGATIEETANYVENILPKLSHWFTVDDLIYLKRGGRISPTIAFVGSVLGIKPILHVNNEGKLVSVEKARGRKAALNSLVEKFQKFNCEEKVTVFISHADCYDEAQIVANKIEATGKAEVKLITDIGPVIGAHSGPGTIALFFIGNER